MDTPQRTVELVKDARAAVGSSQFMFKTLQLVEKELFISGFMSVATTDRDTDYIEPQYFDTETFMKNPQLWVNHRLWLDESGNGKAVGTVDSMTPVQVKMTNDGSDTISLVDLATGKMFKENVPAGDFKVTDGLKGMWVVCKVVEPAVIDLAETKRLNAFSWQGTIYRRKDGRIALIDIYEVSLVNVPANQYALFRIGKSMQMFGADGTTIVIDLEAIKSLDTGSEEAPAANPTEKGGEPMEKPEQTPPADTSIADTLKSIATATEQIPAIAEQVKAMDARLAEVEKSKAAEQPVTPPVTQPDTSAADASKGKENAAASGDDELKAALAGISKQLEAIPAIQTQLSGIDTRLKSVESARAVTSKAASDDDAAQFDPEAVRVEVAKALRDMDPVDRRIVERTALGRAFVPPTVSRR